MRYFVMEIVPGVFGLYDPYVGYDKPIAQSEDRLCLVILAEEYERLSV